MSNRIKAIPKEVLVVKLSNGKMPVKQGINVDIFNERIYYIQTCITTGTPIPEYFYKQSQGRDWLLEERGWLHLHVGHGIDDSVLLIVKQLTDRVIFIALTNHDIFDERPRGQSLLGLGSKIKKLEEDAVTALKKELLKQKSKIKSLSKKEQYDIIDSIMKTIAKDNNIKEPELHKLWVDKYKIIPDKWIINEAGKIGPHTGREYELIVSGQKPATIQYEGEKDVPKFMNLVRQGRLVATKSWQDWQETSYYLYFFALPQYAENIKELKKIYDNANERKKKNRWDESLKLTYFEHERIGQLLGYSKEDIDLFINNCKKNDEKRKIYESKSYPL